MLFVRPEVIPSSSMSGLVISPRRAIFQWCGGGYKSHRNTMTCASTRSTFGATIAGLLVKGLYWLHTAMKCASSSQVVQSCEIWCYTLLWTLSFPKPVRPEVITSSFPFGPFTCSLEISRRRAILLLLRRAAIFRATSMCSIFDAIAAGLLFKGLRLHMAMTNREFFCK